MGLTPHILEKQRTHEVSPGRWDSTTDWVCDTPCCLTEGRSGLEAAVCSSNSKRQQRIPAYCCWMGVTCCKETLNHAACDDNVVSVDFPSFDLNGSLGWAMDGLIALNSHGLSSLDISSNSFRGALPLNISSLSNMVSLDISNNCE